MGRLIRLFGRLRPKRDRFNYGQHRDESGWDTRIGTDLLAAMIESRERTRVYRELRKQRQLP